MKRLLQDASSVLPSTTGPDAKAKTLMTNAFLAFLSNLVGFAKDALDPAQPLAMCGIDSLSGVSCQYWFWRGEFRFFVPYHLSFL